MGTYGFCNGSIASVTNESLMIMSAVAGIVTKDLKFGKGSTNVKG